jgi:hypothetical protein
MNDIEPGSVKVSSEIIRTDINSSKKQAWLKELDKARQLVTDEKPASGDGRRTGGDMVVGNRSDNRVLSAGVPAFSHDLQARTGLPGFTSIGPEIHSVVAGAANASRVPAANAGVPVFPAIDTVPVPVSTQGSPLSTNKAADVNVLQSAYRSQFMLQNLKLVPDGDGVRVIFRDYRLDARAIGNVIEKLKQDLKSLGITVYDIMVNGHNYEDSRKV